jgi:hypothetical protein
MKRIGIILLQLLITVAGIWYVFHNPHKRAEVIEALRHTDKFRLAIGFSATALESGARVGSHLHLPPRLVSRSRRRGESPARLLI